MHDRMALKLDGKDDNLRRADGAIDDMVRRLGGAVDRIALPEAIEASADARKMVEEVVEICRARLRILQ